MGTFSKSFASLGGFVAGDKDVINYIKHNARSFIFSASLPAPNAMAAFAALEVMETEPWHIEKLWENAAFMLKGYRELGFNIGGTQTPIIPIIIGDDEKCFHLWKELFDNGVYCNPVVSPRCTSGNGTSSDLLYGHPHSRPGSKKYLAFSKRQERSSASSDNRMAANAVFWRGQPGGPGCPRLFKGAQLRFIPR